MKLSDIFISKIDKELQKINGIIADLSLEELQKKILIERYTQVIYNIYKRTQKYSRIYHLGHFIITVGSLFVPALLSVQYSETNTIISSNNTNKYQVNIFWATWIISLLVTIFNGVLTLYRVDKKYYLLSTTLERLRTEGWQYFSLTGRYSGHLINHILPTHTNQFIYFCYAIEKIHLKLVAEEFFKNNKDKNDSNIINGSSVTNSITEQSKNNYSVSNEMYVPSPDKKIIAPKPVKDVVNSIIRARTTINSLSHNETKKNKYIKQIKQDKDEKLDESIYMDNLSHYTFETESDTNTSDISDITKSTIKEGKEGKGGKELENEIILIDK